MFSLLLRIPRLIYLQPGQRLSMQPPSELGALVSHGNQTLKFSSLLLSARSYYAFRTPPPATLHHIGLDRGLPPFAGVFPSVKAKTRPHASL